MTPEVARQIALKIERSSDLLQDVVELLKSDTEQAERWPYLVAIGEIYAIQSDQIITPLLRQHPELVDLFPAHRGPSNG